MAKRQARSTVLWCLACFAALQLGLAVVVERRRPEFRDPDYGDKIALLKKVVKDNPGRPLLLVLGSSRVLHGLRPELLPLGGPLVFNFGLPGNGPLHNLIVLRRLLAEGIRPRWVVVEVLPVALPRDTAGEEAVAVGRLSLADLAVLRPYCRRPVRAYLRWAAERLVPWSANRFGLLRHYLPGWVHPNDPTPQLRQFVDRGGYLPLCPPTTPADRPRLLARAHGEYADVLMRPYHVAARPDRAVRELLALCRQKGIAAALLVTPEGEEFRRWYAPGTDAALGAYVAGLGRTYGVAVIDARAWVAEAGFWDSHHLLPAGAAVFTARLGREGLPPLLTGRRPDAGAVARARP